VLTGKNKRDEKKAAGLKRAFWKSPTADRRPLGELPRTPKGLIKGIMGEFVKTPIMKFYYYHTREKGQGILFRI